MHKSSITSPVIFLLIDKQLNVGGTEGRFYVFHTVSVFSYQDVTYVGWNLSSWIREFKHLDIIVQWEVKSWGTAVHLVKVQIYDFYPLPFIRVCNVFKYYHYKT